MSQTAVAELLHALSAAMDFQARAVPVNIEGVLVPVITAEDLIITKVLAGRAKDIEDIRSVIHERRGSLDVERIRTILAFSNRRSRRATCCRSSRASGRSRRNARLTSFEATVT